MFRYIVCTAALLGCCSAQAADLLMEVSRIAYGELNRPTDPLLFEFRTSPTRSINDATGYLGRTYMEADQGIPFAASAAQVAVFNTSFHVGSGTLWLNCVSSPLYAVYRTMDELWLRNGGDLDPNPFFIVTSHVPQLGPGFTGYTITDVTQTVDSIHRALDGTSLYAGGWQHIRIYGSPTVVPEPAAWLLLLVGAALAHVSRRCRV